MVNHQIGVIPSWRKYTVLIALWSVRLRLPLH
jgi:hypothetical protein